MKDQMQALARRAVACKHWRWMPGMLWIIPAQPGWVGDNKGRVLAACEDGGPVSAPALVIPDLTDPATLGCLLALVRKAWGDPSLCANDAGHYDLMFWHVYTHDRNVSVGCQTEAEALVAALEGAP